MSGILTVIVLITPTLVVLALEILIRRRRRSTRYEREVDE